MTRVLERLDDYRPLLDAVTAEPPDKELQARLRGTELIQCGDGNTGCNRAVVAYGPLDIDLTCELADEGWSYAQPWHYCPEHGDQR